MTTRVVSFHPLIFSTRPPQPASWHGSGLEAPEHAAGAGQSVSEGTGHSKPLPAGRGARRRQRLVCDREGCRGAAVQERSSQTTMAAPRTPLDSPRASMYDPVGVQTPFLAMHGAGARVHGAVGLHPKVVGSGRMGDGGPGRERWMRSTGSESCMGRTRHAVPICAQRVRVPRQSCGGGGNPRVKIRRVKFAPVCRPTLTTSSEAEAPSTMAESPRKADRMSTGAAAPRGLRRYRLARLANYESIRGVHFC